MAARTFRFDLHLHSCLSPCGELEMSPRAIVAEARRLGLDGLALTDHQSTGNCPAFAACCAAAGLAAWYGLEMCTAEEVHLLALFDELADALAFGARWRATLPPLAHRAEVFGEQVLVDADEHVLGFETQLLAVGSRWTLPDAVAAAHAAGALVVASHVDRPLYSVPSQLGFLTGEEGFDAVELSARAPWERLPEGLALAGYPVVRNSDAHAPWQMGTQWNVARLERFRVADVRAALREGRVRHGRPVGGAG